MDVPLSITDRIMLLQILPTEGKMLDMMIVNPLRQQIWLTDEEMARVGFRQEENQAFWQQDKEFDKTITFGPNGTRIVLDALKKLDEEGKIPVAAASLCQKFGYSAPDGG